MIYIDIVQCFEAALGTSLDSNQRTRVVDTLAFRLGGGPAYLPSFPQMRRQRQLESVDMAGLSLDQISQRTGIPVRTIKRLRNGK